MSGSVVAHGDVSGEAAGIKLQVDQLLLGQFGLTDIFGLAFVQPLTARLGAAGRHAAGKGQDDASDGPDCRGGTLRGEQSSVKIAADRNAPSGASTETVSPDAGSPSTRAMAPEKIHGWR